jgi:hypothetical protein
MWWKYVLEAVLIVILLGLSSSMWSLVRAPSHLKFVLADSNELASFLNYLGHQRIRDEVNEVEPVFGSFERNISLWQTAHRKSMRQSVFLLCLLCFGVLVGSHFLGMGYVIVNTSLFFLAVLAAPSASVKNQNMTHIHTITLNLLKWNTVDPGSCSRFCATTRPDLKTLYDVLIAME